MKKLNDSQIETVIDALNYHLNYVFERLSLSYIGDIERKNLQLDKENILSILKHLQQ
jgi:hypothetical protein